MSFREELKLDVSVAFVHKRKSQFIVTRPKHLRERSCAPPCAPKALFLDQFAATSSNDRIDIAIGGGFVPVSVSCMVQCLKGTALIFVHSWVLPSTDETRHKQRETHVSTNYPLFIIRNNSNVVKCKEKPKDTNICSCCNFVLGVFLKPHGSALIVSIFINLSKDCEICS